MVRLGDIFNKTGASVDPQSLGGDVNFIGLENISQGTGEIVGEISCNALSIKSTKTLFESGNILFGKLRPNLNKVAIVDFEGICSTDILVLRPKSRDVLGNFYTVIFRQEKFNKEVLLGIKGAQLPRVGYEYLSQIKIPLPRIDVQEDIMKKVKNEMYLVNQSKLLIEIFERKIRDRIAEIWIS
jgi:restriction endonuclease S subunit